MTVEIKKLGQNDLQRLMRRSAAALELTTPPWGRTGQRQSVDAGLDGDRHGRAATAAAAPSLPRRPWPPRRYGSS